MRPSPALGLWAGLAILLLASGCATARPLPAPPEPARPDEAPAARLEPRAPAYQDQHRLILPYDLVLDAGETGLSIETLDCTLSIEGAVAGRISMRPGRAVPGRGSTTIPLELLVDLRDLGEVISGSGGPASAAWLLEARLALRRGGELLELPVVAEGSFPIVREPRFRITSIRIERDLLVTTNLVLGLEIENPNSFPLELGSFGYGFYGEGRLWADGRGSDPLAVPAGGRASRSLGFEMNFADMDRRLFDLVAALKVVRYRLAGEARMATGLAFLPYFSARFDQEGSCAVER